MCLVDMCVCVQPSKKRKNIERGAMGDKVGRIHMMRQDTSQIHVTSMKKLDRATDARQAKKQKREAKAAREAAEAALNEDSD